MKKDNRNRDPMPPPDATPEEIGEFWDSHDLADYWDETQEAEFQVDLKSKQNQARSDETKPNLPATVIDESNTMLGAATDLALDSAIPAPIRRNVLKALDRLGSALIDIPVGALERKSSEKRAESEARIKITETVNAQIMEQIKIDPEFPQRASNTFAKKILREQYNLEKILSFATDILKKKKYDNSTNQQSDNETEKSIDDDWFNIFEKEGSQKSSEEVQHRFARVLAGEIEKPCSYSIRTVKILGELDQYAAALFKRLCSACVFMEFPFTRHIAKMKDPVQSKGPGRRISDMRVLSLGGDPGQGDLDKYGLGFHELNVLNEYDLIISVYNSSFEYNLSVNNKNWSPILPFSHQAKEWILLPSSEQNENQGFKWSGVEFSQTGRELFQIVDIDPMPEYTEDLKKFFAEQNLIMAEA